MYYQMLIALDILKIHSLKIFSYPEGGEKAIYSKNTHIQCMDIEKEIHDIDGVGEKLAEKLIDAGYFSLLSICATEATELAERIEIGVGTAQRIIRNARKILNLGFETAEEIKKRRRNIEFLTTGSEQLDALLGGGIQTQAITEVHGPFGSGKSQLAFQLSVNCQLPKEEGGLQGGCVFIDTENTFRPHRIEEIAGRMETAVADPLGKIHVARAYSSDHQLLLAEKIQEIVREYNIKLVIIDSLTSHFRAEFTGRGSLSERQQKLNRHLHLLQRLADSYNLAIFVTNQVMAKPEGFFGTPFQAIGGNIVAHAATYRVSLRRASQGKRIGKLIDSPDLPEAEAVFKVDASGVGDI